MASGTAESTRVRFVHLSDIHLASQGATWQYSDWLSKRLSGWFNLRFLGRHQRFVRAEPVLAILMEEVERHRPDRVIFSGDATALGFEVELAKAANLLRVETLPGLAVPGNHDYYTRSVAASGLFERYFTPWQQGVRVDEAVYPFAQRAGPVWLVGVNSCAGNRVPWDASGSVGSDQLARLDVLLGRLDAAPRILVTHYPACLADGRPEKSYHGLRDLPALRAVAEKGGVSLWLHGHRHHPYFIQKTSCVPFPLVCAGSATQEGAWSYGDYTIEGRQFRGVRRVYSPEQNVFQEMEVFELAL